VKAFNSLYEIQEEKIVNTETEEAFNSLYEIPWNLSTFKIMLWFSCTFNSLYEIRMIMKTEYY